MACGCTERREAIGRAMRAVMDRQPAAAATVRTEARRVASTALADLKAMMRLREQGRGKQA